MQLDIESLRVFLTVLDTGGMTSAAKKLHMGQSAVSRKVSRLEEKAGQSLLIRDGHDLRPTRAGRALLPDARMMVDIHDQAAARLCSSDLAGSIKLSANGEINMGQITSLLGAFSRRHPGAEVEFVLDDTGTLSERIDAGAVDVALFQVTDRSLRNSDTVLWSEDLAFVRSESDRFASSPIPFLDFHCCFYNTFAHAALETADIPFKTVFSAATSVDVRAAVQAGLGVAVMSERYLGDDVVKWTPPADIGDLPRIHQIVRTVPGDSSEVVTALVDTIREQLGEI